MNVTDFFPEELLQYPLNVKILEIIQYVFDTYGDTALDELLKFYAPENSTQLDRLLRTYGVKDMVNELVLESEDTDYFSQNPFNVIASSNTAGHQPSYSADLDLTTYWESSSYTNEFLRVHVGLSSPVIIRKMVIDNTNIPLDNCPNEFEIQGSTNGTTYTTIYTGVFGRQEKKSYTFKNNKEYIYHRVLFKNSVGGTSTIKVSYLQLFSTRLDTKIAVVQTIKNLLSMKGTMKALYYTMAKSDVPSTAQVIEWFQNDFYPLKVGDIIDELYGTADIKINVDHLTKDITQVQARFNAIAPFLLPWYFHIYRWILLKELPDENIDLPDDELNKQLEMTLEDTSDFPSDVRNSELQFFIGVVKYFAESFQMNAAQGAVYGDGSLYGDGTIYGGFLNAYNDLLNSVTVVLPVDNYGLQFGSTSIQADGTIQYDGTYRTGPNPDLGIFDFVTITTTP